MTTQQERIKRLVCRCPQCRGLATRSAQASANELATAIKGASNGK